MLQILFDESWASRQQDLREAQDDAAKRTIRRREEKACSLLNAPGGHFASSNPLLQSLPAPRPLKECTRKQASIKLNVVTYFTTSAYENSLGDHSCLTALTEQAKASRRRRGKQRHIFYTDPPMPQAGQVCTIFYNPDITNLRGRPEIWLRGSFNRYTHREKFGPLEMHPLLRGSSGFHKAQVQVSIHPSPDSDRNSAVRDWSPPSSRLHC